MTWIAPEPTPPAEEPLVGDDRIILKAFLAWQRHTLLNICAGLTAEQLTQRALPPSNLSARFVEECRLADVAVTETPFDQTFTHRDEEYSVRLVYVHMVTEYARHNGHADLLRERIDGTTGQ